MKNYIKNIVKKIWGKPVEKLPEKELNEVVAETTKFIKPRPCQRQKPHGYIPARKRKRKRKMQRIARRVNRRRGK